MRLTLATVVVTAGLALTAGNTRQAEAGLNSSEDKVGNASIVGPVDKAPLSSTPGAAPDNSTIEPREPVTR